jgi:RimJ/RimL family protein N-acetyltransferase
MIDKPVLRGDGMTLRPMGLEHAQVMFESLTDPESMRLTGTSQEFTIEQCEAFYTRIPDDPSRLDYGIYEDSNPDRVCGEVVINGIDWEARTSNFRVAIHWPADRNRGLGRRAIRLLFQHAFEVVGLKRIDLEVYTFNPRAIHVYESLGFVRTGLQKAALEWEGETTDAIEMQLTADTFTP